MPLGAGSGADSDGVYWVLRGAGAANGAVRGKAVQLDPMKPVSKPPGSVLFELRYVRPLSKCAFNFNLRRYSVGANLTVNETENSHRKGPTHRLLLTPTATGHSRATCGSTAWHGDPLPFNGQPLTQSQLWLHGLTRCPLFSPTASRRNRDFWVVPGTTHAITTSYPMDASIKLSVGGTCPTDLLEIEGLLIQGTRRDRTVGEPVGGILEMDSSDWVERDSIPRLRYQTRH